MNCLEKELKEDLDKVEGILSSVLTGSAYEANVNAMCLHVVKAGGKRTRPKLCLLAQYALGVNDPKLHKAALSFAASTELLHTATLVHDDVIDKATIRRGQSTLNDTEGNHLAVLAGDYLFTRCFFCIHDIDNRELFLLFNKTLATLVTGEINQLHLQNQLSITIEDYKETIYCKTGALFELATAGAALLSKVPEEQVKALGEYGKQLGIAFQVADDILDYTSTTNTLGKTIGEDLLDGRITLPLIFALQDTTGDDHAKLEEAIHTYNLDAVLEYIQKTNSIDKCKEFALEAVQKAKEALKVLPESKYIKMLEDLAYKAANRSKQNRS